MILPARPPLARENRKGESLRLDVPCFGLTRIRVRRTVAPRVALPTAVGGPAWLWRMLTGGRFAADTSVRTDFTSADAGHSCRTI